MNKDEAIASLKEQIRNIRLVRGTARFGATFKEWHRDTRVALEHIFPSSKEPLNEFIAIQYDPAVSGPSTTEAEYDAVYIKGLEHAEVFLQSCIKEIQKYWKEQDPAQKTSTEVLMDRNYMLRAISEAGKCQGEDNRIHPKVGVVVVKNGDVLASAFRGEIDSGGHAEYTALEKKLSTQSVAGATVYTTLEPCTTRNHPKIPCANRLIERKIARVVIGMLDPNQRICGRGLRRLREANITTDLFPSELMAQVEEQNREFIRECQQASNVSEQITLQDVSRASGLSPDEPSPSQAGSAGVVLDQQGLSSRIDKTKPANLFWLGNDLMELFDALLRGGNRDKVVYMLRQANHHLKSVGLDVSPLQQRVLRLVQEAEKSLHADWNEQRRIAYAQEIRSIVREFGNIVEASQPGFQGYPKQ